MLHILFHVHNAVKITSHKQVNHIQGTVFFDKKIVIKSLGLGGF